jgi:Bacteriophage protein gp37
MKQSKIEWTEATWNPSVGCSKITTGCKNCYAEVMSKRLQAMGTPGYEEGFKFKILPERLIIPFNVKKPTKFFVNSMSDLFHEEMPFDFLDEVFEVISLTPHHHYQILTKRANILADYFKERKVPDNVWLGVTVESPENKGRVDVLRNIDARIRFISIEPLVADVGVVDFSNIHWVIVGGESGNRARPMDESWVLNIQKQCRAQNIAFFFKQWGTWGVDGVKRNKKVNGSKLLGKEWKEEPVLV